MEYLQPIPSVMKAEDLLQALYGCLENSDDGFLVVDPEGRIAYINQAYCDYIGKDKSIIGQPVLDYINTSTLAEAAVDQNYTQEKRVLHRVSDEQYADGEHYCIVNRSNVSVAGRSVAGVGQIKFVRSTMQLSASIREMHDEMEYYKEELHRLSAERYSLDRVIGSSPAMQHVKQMVRRSAANDFPVLITGETGTGKEVIANAIHYASERRNRPFIRLNCAAIPPNLLESELFGYEKGAFTGASKNGKKGKFELAHTGTIFLDEIGDMPMDMQAKILRVLQEKEVERIGSEKPIPIDVRVIAATNKDLPEAIAGNRFRSDLYYRLNVISIQLPPLRDRASDINLFIDQFMEKLNEKYHSNVSISSEARQALTSYPWPGNVRELKNIVERCYVLQDSGMIDTAILPSQVLGEKKAVPGGSIHVDSVTRPVSPADTSTLEEAVHAFEKDLILTSIRQHRGNLRATAADLGIHRVTLYKKMEKYGISREDAWCE